MEQGVADIETEPSGKVGGSVSLLQVLLEKFEDLRSNIQKDNDEKFGSFEQRYSNFEQKFDDLRKYQNKIIDYLIKDQDNKFSASD